MESMKEREKARFELQERIDAAKAQAERNRLGQFATPNAGIFSFPAVNPNSTLTVAYVPGTDGLYELTWDANAPIGFVNSGMFVATAEWCDTTGACSSAPDQMAAYSATVTPNSAVPEPATALLFATGLATAALRKKGR